MRKALEKENFVDSQRAPCQHAKGSMKPSSIDATGQHCILRARELAVRIKTKVTDGMRFCRVDAAKGLHLTRFAPKITCEVWTQRAVQN